MAKAKAIREVIFTTQNHLTGYAVVAPDGEVDTFFPAKVHEATEIGYTDTVEVPVTLFHFVAYLQRQGVEVVFRL